MVKLDRTSYCNRCEVMDFQELRQFIDESLKQVHEAVEESKPETEPEFHDLLEMLRGKITDGAIPYIPPIPVGAKDLGFKLFEELQDLHNRKRELQNYVGNVYANPKSSKRSLRHHEFDLEDVRSQIRQLKKQFKKHMGYAYGICQEKRFKSYSRIIEQRRKVIENLSERERKLLKLVSRRKKIVDRVEKSIESAFLYGASVRSKQLSWKVLPPGESSADSVLRYYERLQRYNPDIKFDKERLSKALLLRPNNYYVGTGEFEKYIVLTFKHTSKALFECPEFGNAIYIIHSDWQRLSRLSKRDLMTYKQHQATKIVHREDWFARVKRELGIR